MSSKAKIFALRKAIDAGMLSKEQALIAISQGMENKVRSRIKTNKPLTFDTLTDEIRKDDKFLEQMARLEINMEVIDKIAGGYLVQETLDKITADIGSNKKIGRNEPCPCGSGKKYKKCCGG